MNSLSLRINRSGFNKNKNNFVFEPVLIENIWNEQNKGKLFIFIVNIQIITFFNSFNYDLLLQYMKLCLIL